MKTDSRKLPCLVLLIGALILFNACKKKPEPVIDEQPQILSMSLSGIPQNNITIDQQQQVITVLLPGTLPDPELVPTFTLSRQAQLGPFWAANDKTISLAKYCPCGGYNSPLPQSSILELGTRVDNQKKTSYYMIKIKASQSLRLKSLQEPIIYDLTRTPEIVVPVENYYSNALVAAFSVTKTGSTLPNFRISGCVCSKKDEIKIPLSGYRGTLKPGLHDLDLWLADGTHLHATDAILVK